MKAPPDAKGVYVIAPTPFHPDGRIDESSIDRMCDFFVKAGVDGMTILGQLGEAPKMSHEESVGIVKRVMSRVKLPIVVGVSAPGFAAMRALTQDVMALGASGVMIAPPNTLRTDDSIVQYYKQASEAIGADVPFVIQDYPLTFSVQMTPAVIKRIRDDVAEVLKIPDVRKRLNEIGGDPSGMPTEEFAKMVRSEIEKWNKVAKAAGVKPQ